LVQAGAANTADPSPFPPAILPTAVDFQDTSNSPIVELRILIRPNGGVDSVHASLAAFGVNGRISLSDSGDIGDGWHVYEANYAIPTETPAGLKHIKVTAYRAGAGPHDTVRAYINLYRRVSTTLGLPIAAGWNILSVPLIVSGYQTSTIFPTASSPAFAFVNGYIQRDTLQNGLGYWIKFPGSEIIQLSGAPITEDTIDVNADWNLLGSLSSPIPTSYVTPVPPVAIVSHFYGFSTSSGYFSEDTLKPGSGYWVKVSQVGQLVFASGAQRTHPSKILTHSAGFPEGKEGINTLGFKDALNNERKLYFSSTRTDHDVRKYELPPLPPEGTFDVRFESQRAFELTTGQGSGTRDFLILITGATFPLVVTWDVADDTGAFVLELATAGEQPGSHNLRGKGNLVLFKPDMARMKLRATVLDVTPLPGQFVLHQNHPNPFNSVTRLLYELPGQSLVRLKVYDITGREVATVVNGIEDAGYKTAEWNPANDAGTPVAGGIYFYRIQATSLVEPGKSYTRVRKMLHLK
jgi:hypothetical protein